MGGTILLTNLLTTPPTNLLTDPLTTLLPTNQLTTQARLWEARAMLLSRGGAVTTMAVLPRDIFTMLEKHTAPGLTAAYQA